MAIEIYAPGPLHPDLFSDRDTPIMVPIKVRGWSVDCSWVDKCGECGQETEFEKSMTVLGVDEEEARDVAFYAVDLDTWKQAEDIDVDLQPGRIPDEHITQNMIDAYVQWRRNGVAGQPAECTQGRKVA